MQFPALFTLATARGFPKELSRDGVPLMRHGSMELLWYAPPMPDEQPPHDQDELYIVGAGSGVFNRAGEGFPCKAGDVLFVAAGVQHRFEDCSPDFGAWVVFWGPDGGEVPQT